MTPMPIERTWVFLAGLLGASGVLLGAYHAHGLEKTLSLSGLPADETLHLMQAFGTAVYYHLLHAVALLSLGSLAQRHRSALVTAAGALMVGGFFLFSGGIYARVLAGLSLHWAIVPAGGVAWVTAWLLLALAALLPCVSSKPDDSSTAKH